MNEKNKNQMKVNVQADKTVIPTGKPGQRILEINLTAPPAPAEKPHIPLNLSLVIDRSGSMSGNKLKYVKEAAAHVIDLMSDEDRLAVILYDDKVETLANSQYLTDKVKAELKAKLAGVRSGASTFLYGGWLAGCRQIAEAVSDNSFNRTLLLTDGLANVGVRDIGALSVHAQELFTRGISTSCFGVGLDYDEYLLESMVNHGGGSFHFLETLNAIPLVFEREFDEIISVSLQDVRIALDFPENVKASVSSNWHTERDGDRLTIFLGSLTADQSQTLYLQLSNLHDDLNSTLEIPVMVIGKDHDSVQHKIKTFISFKSVSDQEEADIEQDSGLMERFAVVDLADKAKEALKRERAGDRVGSSRFMKNSLDSHSPHITKEIRKKYELYSDQMEIGLDEVQRKRRHYQEYQSNRGYQSIRDYRLTSDKGPLIAEIDGKKALISTGANTSIGRESEWFFLDKVHHLPSEIDSINCDQISSILKTNVDLVFGMDILKDLFVRIYPDRLVIQFSRHLQRARGVRLSLDQHNGSPSCQVYAAGEPVRMRLLTGSRLSYLPAPLFEDQTTDFKTAVQVGGVDLTLACGVLTDAIRVKLDLGDGEGVLGAELFQRAPATLAFPEDALVLLI